MSSDSPFFDRYPATTRESGACESASSPDRSWFTFRKPIGDEPTNVCAPSTPGGEDTYYDGWFGFYSIPVLTKSNAQVQKYFLTSKDSVTQALAPRKEPPAGAWTSWAALLVPWDRDREKCRHVVKSTKSDARIISETWQKDSTLLRMLQGDRADTTMNYRLRDAVIGLSGAR